MCYPMSGNVKQRCLISLLGIDHIHNLHPITNCLVFLRLKFLVAGEVGMSIA